MASNLPEGAEFEKNAPWNDPGDCPEWMECTTCNGDGILPEDPDDPDIDTQCPDCYGKGKIEISDYL